MGKYFRRTRDRNLGSTLALLLISLALTATAVSCTGNPNGDSAGDPDQYSGLAPSATAFPVLDPSTATLDQILELTRTAMGEIASYKTRGTLVVENSSEDSGSSFDLSTEWRFPDRYRIQYTGIDADTGEETTSGIRFIGNRIFQNSAESGWVEQPEGSDSGEPDLLFSAHLELLDAYDIELISSNEVTDDGVGVYRLEYSQDFGPDPAGVVTENDGSGPRRQTRTTLLIDQETFLYVTVIQEQRVEFIVTETRNGVPKFMDEWARTVTTSHYYDYDRSVSIEPPPEYITWAEFTAPTPTATAEPPAHVDVTEASFTLPPPGSTFIEDLLGQFPAPAGESYTVTLNNFEALREYAGVERPGPELDWDAITEVMRTMFATQAARKGPLLIGEFPVLTGLMSQLGDDQFGYLGMDIRSVDQAATTELGGLAVEILLGDYSLERTTSSLDQCAECVPYEINTFDGVDYFSWNWQVGDRNDPPLFGAGIRRDNILVQDGLAVATSRPETMNTYIQTLHGDRQSLLDIGDFQLVARGLGALDVISAKFTIDDFSRSNVVPREDDLALVNMADSGPLMKPFGLVAYGSGHDGIENYTALVIAHESHDLAVENSELLIRRIREADTARWDPWTDLIKGIEIEVIDRLILAKIHTHNIASGVAFNPSRLIIHE